MQSYYNKDTLESIRQGRGIFRVANREDVDSEDQLLYLNLCKMAEEDEEGRKVYENI